MFKWIKNRFSYDIKETSHKEEIMQEPIVHRDRRDVQSERNENFVVHQQVDSELEIYNESNNLEQPKRNYQREYSSLFLHEEVKKEESQMLLIEKENSIFRERKRREEKSVISHNTLSKAEEIMKPKSKSTIKKTFKPTQVPSPIYGFGQRPGTEKKEEVITPKEIVIVEELQSKQKEKEFIVETMEEVRHLNEEQTVEVIKEIDNPVTEAVEKVEEAVTELSDAKKEEERPKSKKRVVPYNVIMRQQDRRKMMRERREREKQSAGAGQSD